MFVGDDGYGLKLWLMTPLKNEPPGSPSYRYNDDLCKARSCVERFFGIWKSVFRCLSAQRQLMYEPSMAGKIVNACAVLHNMRIAHRIYDIELNDDFVHDLNRQNIFDNEDRQYVYQGRATANKKVLLLVSMEEFKLKFKLQEGHIINFLSKFHIINFLQYKIYNSRTV
ncbi:Putative nuclease HARBI1 [Trachymyrmex zeteki]|uniref:Putative nuclease HARBI1 n=1 Tax=Mycetomoellerius zeteki TaxID=64791 RepID=A0A151XF19_9HYME|nr:Putative nuclease HARBI1 [Trachymyrmex zeteki]